MVHSCFFHAPQGNAHMVCYILNAQNLFLISNISHTCNWLINGSIHHKCNAYRNIRCLLEQTQLQSFQQWYSHTEMKLLLVCLQHLFNENMQYHCINLTSSSFFTGSVFATEAVFCFILSMESLGVSGSPWSLFQPWISSKAGVFWSCSDR